MSTNLRIAMVGLKGLPATWGGIERHVEELGARLTERGHEVTVFSRRNYNEDAKEHYRGMRLVHLRTVNSKHLEAILHSAWATILCLKGRFDVIHYHGVGSGLVAPLVRLIRPRVKVVMTVHGLDADRAKWGGSAQTILSAATWMSAKIPHRTVVVSKALADHFREAYQVEAVPIVNGVNVVPRRTTTRFLDSLGVKAGSYALFVGRLVPEKSPDLLIEAFRQVVGDDFRLVIAGGSSHTDDYVDALREAARRDPRIIMPGYVHGEDLEELYSNAGVFVIPSSLEGLPLTLLEAISYRLPVLASRIPPHVEVLESDAPGGRLFDVGDAAALARGIKHALEVREQDGSDLLQRRVISEYSWEGCTDAVEDLYLDRQTVNLRKPVVPRAAAVA